MADAKPDYCGFTVDELKEIVNSYKCRKGIDDDLEYIKNQNGKIFIPKNFVKRQLANQLIEVGLHVEVETGLNSDDVPDRRKYYGSNAKDIQDPPSKSII